MPLLELSLAGTPSIASAGPDLSLDPCAIAIENDDVLVVVLDAAEKVTHALPRGPDPHPENVSAAVSVPPPAAAAAAAAVGDEP